MGKFVVHATSTGFVFALKATNGETIGTSEVYASERACRAGIESVIRNAPVAEVEDQIVGTTAKNPKFEIYSDKRGEARFRLKAKNGEIILASEGYSSKASCQKGIDSVRRNAPESTVFKVTE